MSKISLSPARLARQKAHRLVRGQSVLAALFLAFGSQYFCNSSTADEKREAPAQGAKPEPGLVKEDDRPSAAARLGGETHSYRIQSTVLKQTRRVSITTPASFAQTSRCYPVIVVFDGEYLGPDVVNAAGYLAKEGQVPEAIVVGIHNIAGKREHDLTPPGLSVSGSGLNEGGDRFLDFIEQELVPTLEKEFRVSKPRVLVGLSAGATLATYAAATRGSVFPFIVALDPPAHLAGDWLPARLTDGAG